MLDFIGKLRRDMLEQFKGHPNIEVYQKALARQLDDLHGFFSALNALRWLQDAEGVQLDGIGDIVVMSRMDATVISRLAHQEVPMDDTTYRLYLAWKIALNTTNCTQTDVYNALKMFWHNSPLYYSEDIDHPATIFFSTPTLRPEDDVGVLLLAPKVKAAGVALEIIANTETPDMGDIEIVIAGAFLPGIMQTTLPQYLPDGIHEKDLYIGTFATSVQQTTLDQID